MENTLKKEVFFVLRQSTVGKGADSEVCLSCPREREQKSLVEVQSS